MTTTFGLDGISSGSSGCISDQAGYEVDGKNITNGLSISTMIGCAESDGMMEQEQEYPTYLCSTTFHRPN